MSYGSNFWNNIRNDDIDLYRRKTLAERLAKKLRKHELDLKFLVTARDTGVYPKFTHWKNVKNNNKKHKSKFYRRVLLDEINSKRCSTKELKKELPYLMETLSSSTTFFKGIVLRISINRSVLKDEKKIVKRHQKKLENRKNIEKNIENNIHENPNPVVTNLSSHNLTNEEHSILKFGLKHGLATHPNESNILLYAEDIWEQIDKANICRSEMYSKAKIKNALRGLAFNLINIEDSRIFKD